MDFGESNDGPWSAESNVVLMARTRIRDYLLPKKWTFTETSRYLMFLRILFASSNLSLPPSFLLWKGEKDD